MALSVGDVPVDDFDGKLVEVEARVNQRLLWEAMQYLTVFMPQRTGNLLSSYVANAKSFYIGSEVDYAVYVENIVGGKGYKVAENCFNHLTALTPSIVDDEMRRAGLVK